jgi:hypothetical protein
LLKKKKKKKKGGEATQILMKKRMGRALTYSNTVKDLTTVNTIHSHGNYFHHVKFNLMLFREMYICKEKQEGGAYLWDMGAEDKGET